MEFVETNHLSNHNVCTIQGEQNHWQVLQRGED